MFFSQNTTLLFKNHLHVSATFCRNKYYRFNIVYRFRNLIDVSHKGHNVHNVYVMKHNIEELNVYNYKIL